MARRTRYATALLYFIVIGGTAAFIIWDQTRNLVPSGLDVLFWQGIQLSDFILILLLASIPILFLEYMIFALPIAMGFLFTNRLIRAASYEMNIMNIGTVFEGRHMIRRAAAPALFSVASSDMMRVLIQPWVFPQYQNISEMVVGSLDYATLSLMGALLFMPISLLLFMPTWILNDSGIVTHLKENKMAIRQCPDTQGVGRWVSGIFGGFALIAFPLTMFNTHFLPHLLAGTLFADQNLLNALLLIMGLPLFVMAFILPVIMFNERNQVRIRTRMAAFATKLGSTIIRKERIEKAKRITREGILTEEGGQEIVSTAKTIQISKTEKNIVSSRKTIKKAEPKKDSKKSDTKKKKK
ncbi:MAG: hypothetical protein ACFFED_10150 [Candidatus Thorarchaeota archaeon]